MTNCRFLRFCIVVLLVATALLAKTIPFSGRVIDSETETGLPGVSISLLKSKVKAITDQNGQFSLSADASLAGGRIECLQRDLLMLRRNARVLDLKSAPRVTSVGIYNLKGERLFFKEKRPESDMLPMPGLPKNIYMMRITTHNGNFFDVKWVHMGNSFTFTLGTFGNTTGSLSKQARIIDSLVFEKQGYQTKGTGIDSDSSSLSMNIKMKPEIGYGIFNDDTIRTYRIRLGADDMAMLLDYSKLITGQTTVNTVYVPARLEFQGRTMDSIGVRFRGNQSLWDCISNGKRKKNLRYPQYGFGNGDICAKFSMKFDFNQYKKNCRLYGLKALNFRSMSADPTKMHERLAFSIFNDMGITSPQCAYARLYVNDTLWGLFGITEQIDDRFTKSHYPKAGDGNLYKEIWPDAGAIDASILEALKTNNDPEDTPNISRPCAMS
jgi:hypothetical protein